MPDYVAGLCFMENSEAVPVETLNITAKDDNDAVRQAIEWRVSTLTTIDRPTWLQVLHDGKAVFSKEIGRI
jgi:hypothetical protein